MEIIGRTVDGKFHPTFKYRMLSYWENVRIWFAFRIAPELKTLADRERFKMDYLLYVNKSWLKDVRGKEKAIRRLQAENKFLKKKIKSS